MRERKDQVVTAEMVHNLRVESACGMGLATITSAGEILDTWFPAPGLETSAGLSATQRILTWAGAPEHGADARRDVEVVPVRTFIRTLAEPPIDVHDAYLRLHLLSHRIVAPRTINLDGIFAILPIVAWTELGPCKPDRAQAARLRPLAIDKFPRMTDYVILPDIRIADASRVRLGAHLAPGTTIMHEGFCNFNAGTLGACMVEGRISAGVVVGEGTDIGGGASIMGTLSGGGQHVISVGRRCLIGANAGIGISLGDDCVVEAGCYVTAGAKISLADTQHVVKAQQLSGESGLLYRRNSLSGALEALPRSGGQGWDGLNHILHAGVA